MLLSTTCVACGRPGHDVCPACATELRRPREVPRPPGVDRCQALLVYEGAARELVLGLKYRNARPVLGRLARALACLIDEDRRRGLDVVTWAPTSPARRRARGFDQAELLARGVGRQLRVPVVPLLQRAPGAPQTGQDRRRRLTGPVFTCRTAPTACLVVDDVVTTGATAGAAARALRSRGATLVDVVAAACTPTGTLRGATAERDEEHGSDGPEGSR